MTNKTAALRYARALLDVAVREKGPLDYQQVVRAAVTTATSIGADQTGAIERGLARVTGRTVRLETRVDPSIIGGVVARIGDTIYDGSITRQLERMKESLTGSHDG